MRWYQVGDRPSRHENNSIQMVAFLFVPGTMYVFFLPVHDAFVVRVLREDAVTGERLDSSSTFNLPRLALSWHLAPKYLLLVWNTPPYEDMLETAVERVSPLLWRTAVCLLLGMSRGTYSAECTELNKAPKTIRK